MIHLPQNDLKGGDVVEYGLHLLLNLPCQALDSCVKGNINHKSISSFIEDPRTKVKGAGHGWFRGLPGAYLCIT